MNRSHQVFEKNGLPQTKNYRFSIVLKNFALISLISFLFFTGIFSWLSLWGMALVCGTCAWLWAVIFLVNRNGLYRISFLFGIIISTTFSLFATYLLGWTSGFFYTTLMIIPLIFLNSKMNQVIKVMIVSMIGGLILLMFMLSSLQTPLWTLEQTTLRWLNTINLIFAVVILSITGHYFETAASDAERALILANKKLTGLATTDPVTNLVNRRTMMSRIEQEKERMERGGKSFTLIMVDIDNFKQVNDEYGHDGGDFVLVNLAEMISLSLRKQDEIARWGGDEFLILLPETDLEGGRIVAEKIRARILRSPFVYREMDIPVTVTFGVGLCDSNVGIGSCIRKADQALYVGKQAGKNRVGIVK
ncbi:MAG: diguanylate cyclase [Chloroflexi bacterium]|nr:MAG: diguanylate cyclase [Chloroflexota bacterium]